MEDTSPSVVRLLLYVICNYLLTLLGISIGLISQCVYWLLFDSFGRREKRARRQLQYVPHTKDEEHYAVIIGTGFSGLGMAIKLQQLGVDNYILIERQGNVGGAWYANTYPGCACDVPSNLYSFSFEPNPKWSHYFSRQPEIAAYLEHCTNKYDLRRHIRFNTNVTELRWIDNEQRWKVTTQSDEGETHLYGRSVILGTGPLSNASYPTDITGIDLFEGEMFHTAKWMKNVNFRNKRVAVIGTGASAIQALPEIQKMDISQLFVFQRTPPWIVPRPDRRLHQWEKDLFQRIPLLQKLVRVMLYWSHESFALAFVYRWPLRFINQILARYNLERQVKDETLRKKLTPNWELGCKRMLLTNDWLPTLQQANVKLVTNRIREIRSHSIVTHDGEEFPVDIIIWSTGFQTQTFSLPVYGIDGCSLAERWSTSIQVCSR
jgi:cation diffusion facilitator CzcD-associated flavoprotein CzcO